LLSWKAIEPMAQDRVQAPLFHSPPLLSLPVSLLLLPINPPTSPWISAMVPVQLAEN
ncbi:unnamed protein product, partial [Closterium sp. Naga37s-1]